MKEKRIQSDEKTAPKKPEIFVGGPFQHAINSENGFDANLRLLIESFIEIIEKAGYKILSAHRAELFGEISAKDSSSQVTKRDFLWIKSSQIFLAVLPIKEKGQLYRTDGTHIELGWASMLGKPVIILWDPDSADIYSHLIRGLHTLTRVRFMSIREAYRYPLKLIKVLEEELMITNYWEREFNNKLT